MTIRFDIEVYLALGADISADPSTWTWNTDITDYCMVREGGVSIRRGRGDWLSTPSPATCQLLVNNSDGRFSRLNPLGAYYGQLRKNTPLRVRACVTGGSLETRFVGYVSEFPPRWEPSETHYWVSLRADGVLRRLGQGNSPIRSLARSEADFYQRYFASFDSSTEIVGYWPMEDGAGSTQAESGLVNGGDPLVRTAGTVTFEAETAPPGASAAPGMASASLRGAPRIPSTTATASAFAWTVSCFFKASADCRILTWDYGSGAAALAISGGELNIITSDGLTAAFSGDATIDYTDGEWHSAEVTGSVSGTSTFLSGSADAVESATLTSVVLTGPVRLVQPNPLAEAGLASIGHILVIGPAGFSNPLGDSVMRGLPGTRTSTMFLLACLFNDVPYDQQPSALEISADPDLDGLAMGTFPAGTLRQVLDVIVSAENGLMNERLTGELGFDLRTLRENVAVGLALDYAAGHIKPPFEPADDDSATRNDVRVTREGGGTGRVELATGPTGTDPESGAGRYDEGLTQNLYTADQARQNAGWRVNLGTVDEYRYPLVHLMFHSSASLLTTWLACDIGSRVTIDNMPANMPPDLVDQVLEGYTERINNFEWDVELNLSPYKPYKVFEIADTTADANEWLGRLAGDDNAAIRAAITTTGTTILLDPNRYRWTTTADDFDPDLRVRIGGETADISGISTTAGTYVAAGAASHADNAAVTPAMYAGATTSDLICVLARIRGSAGALAVTGYELMHQIGELCLFARVHDGTEADPTVTPTGGAAGDTVSAFTFGLRGTSCTFTTLADMIVTSVSQTNASAANIAYGGVYPIQQEGCILLLLAGKSDDWTSVAVPSGWTEIAEPTTTTGSDQGLYAAYQIQTTPALAVAGSLVVTGGGSAVSESMVLALAAGYQTLTVSARSVNGVVKAHSAATKIEVENAHVLGL